MHAHSHQHGHDHGHGHGHHHHPAPTVITGAFIAGIILNGLYVLVQIGAGLFTGSMALLSDAGHNLGDVASLALSLFAIKMAKKPATQQFTYGYRKTTIMAALANAVVLCIAIGILGYESIVRLLHPQPIAGDLVAWIAGLGIVINFGSAILFFRDREHDLNTKAAFLHLLTDALVSAGVVVSGLVMRFTGWYWLDGATGIVVLLIILVGTWSLLTDSLKLSLDAVPNNLDLNAIEDMIRKNSEVQDVHHTHIWAMSTTENALTAHVVLNNSLSFEEKMATIHRIKHNLLHHGVQHATIELESEQMPCDSDDC
jgi:cobalt-zinc-cadmium efflux system protein